MTENNVDEIICHCTSITKLDIKQAAKNEKLSELYSLGMASCCGSCRHEVIELIEECLEEDEDSRKSL